MTPQEAAEKTYRSFCGWVTVKSPDDCPPNDDYEDYPTDYVIRIMRDGGRGSNDIVTAKASEIWGIAKASDGRVDWLEEDIIKPKNSNQALSSALKEIAELHAKVKQLEVDLYHAQGNLEIANNETEEWKAKYYGDKTITLKNSDGLSPESNPEPDSSALPPEVAP